MASRESLLGLILQEAHLGQYSTSFQQQGIHDLETLTQLSLQEYDSFGVNPAEDKKQLFRLIHTLRNLDLNKLSDSINGGSQEASPVGSSTSNILEESAKDAPKERAQHRRDEKSLKNHQNDVTSQTKKTFDEAPMDGSAGRNQPRRTKLSDMNDATSQTNKTTEVSSMDGGAEHNQPRRMKLSDTPRNSVLNRTFDKDVDSDTDGSEDLAAPENGQRLQNGGDADEDPNNGSLVRMIEHDKTSYNYGVPSATPPSQHKPRTPKPKPDRTRPASGLASSSGRGTGSGTREVGEEKIRVCVRKRPLSQKEWRAGEGQAVTVEGSSTVLVKERKLTVDLTKVVQVHKYHFDEAFHEDCSNEAVYERTAKPLINALFNKGKATCFAYGQTGAGKTHTLLGDRGSKVKGLFLLAAEDIFAILRSSSDGPGQGLAVYVGYFEIYCGQLFDLLNNRERLHARENAHHEVCITGLNEVRVSGPKALIQVVESGNNVRVVGVSGVNADSSRSHAILQIQLRDKAGNQVGKLSFIDLAGSERACDTNDPDKITRQEGAEINTSLLALKECIRALDQEKRHTPFRQSKLTQVLRDSFLGQSRTCMIACVAPNASAVEHTLNTLRYADRVKELRQEGQLGSSSSTSILTSDHTATTTPKHPPTPSIFSPGNTSTPLKSKRSKQNSSARVQKTSPKKKDPMRRKSAAVSPSTTGGRSGMEVRRKSLPESSSPTDPAAAETKKSTSQHNLQKSATGGSQSLDRKKERSKEVVQRLKYEQSPDASGRPLERRKVIQSGVKVRENRTVEERKMRASATRSRLEMNLSQNSDTPSKRTPEVRARMKKAFLNSSLPIWDSSHSQHEMLSPSQPPPPKMLEYDNPRYIESPSKEQPPEIDQRKQKAPINNNWKIPYSFDVPNPQFVTSPRQQQQLTEVDSGYLPDMDTDIETPRNVVAAKEDGSVADVHPNIGGNSHPHSEVHKHKEGEPKLVSGVESGPELCVETSSDGFQSAEEGQRMPSASSESRPGSLSGSHNTLELLAEIERSLQRSPVPVTPRPGSEPWMRVISEDKFHPGGASNPPHPQSPGSPRDQAIHKTSRKELFGIEKQDHGKHGISHNGTNVNTLFQSNGRVNEPSVNGGDQEPTRLAEQEQNNSVEQGELRESTSVKRKVKQGRNIELGDGKPSESYRDSTGESGSDSDMGRNRGGPQRPSHILKEKLCPGGFAQKERVGELMSPQNGQERQSANFNMHSKSFGEPRDAGLQSRLEAPAQTQSAGAEFPGSRPVTIGQQHGRGTSSSDQFVSAQSHLTDSYHTAKDTNSATPTISRARPQQLALSSTPKAFKHESLGKDPSLMHLSFSAIQSPTKEITHPYAETSKSITAMYEADVPQNADDDAKDIPCEEVVLPVSPRLTLTKSRSDGSLVRASPSSRTVIEEAPNVSSRLGLPKRPSYQRQNSAAERASTHYLSRLSSAAHSNKHKSTRELLLAAHAEQLEETLKLCEAGWDLIGQLRNHQMDVHTYIAQAGDLLDSQTWCIDTFRDQLGSYSRCSSPNN